MVLEVQLEQFLGEKAGDFVVVLVVIGKVFHEAGLMDPADIFRKVLLLVDEVLHVVPSYTRDTPLALHDAFQFLYVVVSLTTGILSLEATVYSFG